MVRGVAVIAALLAAAAADGWQVTKKTSAIDGATTYVANLPSDEPLPNVIGRPEPALLKVQCSEGRLDLYVVFPQPVGTEYSIRGVYRIDDGPVIADGFRGTSDGDAVGFYPPSLVQTMTSLIAAKKLVVRATPARWPPQEAAFTLRDVAPLKEALATCPPRRR